MAHEIYGNLCVYSLDHGGVPWHNIGTALPGVSAEDIRTHAGFGRRVAALPIGIAGESLATTSQAEGMRESIEGYRATVDLSTGRVLGVVTERYAILQPEELLAAADFVVREFGARYSLAAQLHEGKREILSLQLPESSGEVASGDYVKSYFNLANGHDGKLSVCVGSSDIRVVCQNTLSAWLREGAVQIRHRDGVERALARAVAAFTHDAKLRRDFYGRMTGRKMLPSEVIAYFDACVGEADKPDAAPKRGRKSVRARLQDLMSEGRLIGVDTGLSGLPTTLWGAYNAITQLATHESYARDPLANLYFGSGGKLLQVANERAMELVAA
jgi:phage/plasmid-like protein (TIGR03299 family)